jgi:ubiquitin-conjugating enzyme E2 Q
MMDEKSQVRILLMELCRIHSCPLPNEINQLNTFHSAPMASSNQNNVQNHNNGRTPSKNHVVDDNDSDIEDIEDVVGESDQDSDAEEDLPLELDDGRSANKKDEMEVEHLATLERLRQTQRQDYLRVSCELLF